MKPCENRDRRPLVVENIPLDENSQAGRGWELEVNGQVVTGPIGSVVLRNPQMGVSVRYGRRPEGYDSVVIHEPEGGGSVTIPYFLNPKDGNIYIGVVKQYRAGAGGLVDNVPRGFVDPGHTHDEAATQEVREETGLNAVFSRFIRLGGGMNPNTAFFDTSGTTTTGEPEGTAYYALPVRPDEVEPVQEQDGSTSYRIRQELQLEAAGDMVAEGIVGARFIPLQDAVRTSPDSYTSIAAGLLTGHLIGGGALHLAGIEDPR